MKYIIYLVEGRWNRRRYEMRTLTDTETFSLAGEFVEVLDDHNLAEAYLFQLQTALDVMES